MMILLATISLAGMVRGFAGFGTGMIIAPVAAALYGPVPALVIIFIVDTLPVIPVTIPVFKIAKWGEVMPVLAGLAAFMPIGIWILKTGDPIVLRWVICALILAAVAILVSGWRYTGSRSRPISLVVGAVGGIMGGIASIPAPPAIIYWMASPLHARFIRANVLVLLFFGEFFTGFNLWAADLFSVDPVMRGVLAAPFYFAGTVVGLVLFRYASETVYRVIAFAIILVVTIAALPLFDGIFS